MEFNPEAILWRLRQQPPGMQGAGAGDRAGAARTLRAHAEEAPLPAYGARRHSAPMLVSSAVTDDLPVPALPHGAQQALLTLAHKVPCADAHRMLARLCLR